MAENFFSDNADLAYHLDKMDLGEVVEILEDGYRYAELYPDAPRSYADAKDNYRLLLRLLGDICANSVAPRAAEAGEEGVHFDAGRVSYAEATQAAIELLRRADLMGAMLPREYGGLNLPQSIYQLMIELVSRAEAGLMTVFGLQEISASIAEFGDDEMKSRVLPRFACGEVTGAMVLTEPDAGSDLGVVQTHASYDEAAGQWRLSGVKRFITNGSADVLLVLARSEDGSTGARGLSLFEVEADDTVRVRRIEHKMGLSASPTCEIEFCDTPARLVGKRRFGLIRYAMSMMNGARLAVSAQALGIAEAAYRDAERYAAKRIQFGRPINVIPAVYRMLLSMRGEIEATRSLLYETARWVDLKRAYEHRKAVAELDEAGRARLKQADRLVAVLTPLLKYHATEMGNRVCYQAMQVLGGAGYMREFNVERHYRDIRVTSIYEGTSQMQVVAAIGGLLGHSLDDLLAEWAAQDYGEESDGADGLRGPRGPDGPDGQDGPDGSKGLRGLKELKDQLIEVTGLLDVAIDRLREQEREVIDYYAADLVELAVYVVTSWLMLQDARALDRKRDLARVYIAAALPLVRGRAAMLERLDPAPLAVRAALLGG